MNWNSFRAYDIRGVYPTDLDEDAYYRIAKAYTYLFHPKAMVVISTPSTLMVPAVARSSPATRLSSVDLPLPEGPITVVTSPAGICKETPFNAG